MAGTDDHNGTVGEVSRITMTLIIMICGLFLLKYWYTVSDYYYFDVVRAFMGTRTLIGGFHSFLIGFSFWAIVSISLIDMILNNYLSQSYTLKFLASFQIPFWGVCATGVLLIPDIGLTSIRLFWLFCYIILVICSWLSFALISRKSTLSGFISEISEGKKDSEENSIDGYVRLAASALALVLFTVMLVSAFVYGMQIRDLPKDSDDITPIISAARYEKAAALMENGEYKDAIEIFQSISFRDSYEKTRECWNALSSALIGTWYGDAGSILTLQADGICFYVDGSGPEGEGTWTAEGGELLRVDTEALSYGLYAFLGGDFHAISIYVQADSAYWNDETFTR